MTQIVSRAGECIYCGSTDDLSAEHIIPLSLGGKAIITDASCASCRDITSKLEFDVARTTFHMARAIYKLPSRRSKNYPTSDWVRIYYGKYGPSETVSVPFEDSPNSMLFPSYPPQRYDHMGLLSSSVVNVEASLGDEETKRRLSVLMKKYQAYQVEGYSNALTPVGSFESFLWKVAHCLLWIFDRALAITAITSRYVRGLSEIMITEGEQLFVRNIYSRSDVQVPNRPTAAAVFTTDDDSHRFLHFEIQFLRKAGLPAYYCMVDKNTGTPVTRTELL